MNRDGINNLVKLQTCMRVQTGPFTGMRISANASWGDGDITPKLLGTYEQELHPFLERVTSRDYGAIVDIGCAEGYYAVGCARLFNSKPVFAFDADPRALSVLKENVALNEVYDRVQFGGLCGSERLISIAERFGSLFVICDCEGYELQLFRDQSVVHVLKHSDLIIETHDFIRGGTTGAICGWFGSTHKIEIVYSGGRNPNTFSFLSHLSDLDRWHAICENRPCLMNWVICEAIERQPGSSPTV